MTSFFEVAEYNTSTGMIRLTSMTNYNRLNATFYPNPEDDYATLRGQLELIPSGEGKITAPSSPSNGDVLTYDNGTTTWVSAPPVRELFECEYGVTAYADMAAALANNKVLYCYRGTLLYFGYGDSGGIWFYTLFDSDLGGFWVYADADQETHWGEPTWTRIRDGGRV